MADSDNPITIAALQAQIAELNGRLDALGKRVDQVASPENVPASRLAQLDVAISHLGAILREARLEHFRSDVSALMSLIQEKLRPIRERLAAAGGE